VTVERFEVIDRPPGETFFAALALQEELVRRKITESTAGNYLILAEHQEVYTYGRTSAPEHPDGSPFDAVPWVPVNRGGGVTFHGPGQLVAYPVFDLSCCGRDVHVFLRMLEQTGLKFLAKLGIKGETLNGLTGVWTAKAGKDGSVLHKKIASIGIAVRRWISYHGIAINISTDLSYFQAISPCSQDGRVMTSLAQLGGTVPSMTEAKEVLVESFAEVFTECPKKAILTAQSTPVRPAWIRNKAPGSPEYLRTHELVRSLSLHTVCEEAKCPNIGECWAHRTATFMIMGDECTRRCRFCSVRDGTLSTLKPLDIMEPHRVAEAIAKLGLRHAVITSVNRDDLPDMGARHFLRTAQEVSLLAPACDLEFLIPDLRGQRELLEVILESPRLVVLNHNVETVPRLYPKVRPGAKFSRSLEILRLAGEMRPDIIRKSGLMAGLGESADEVLQVMQSLRGAKVQVLTIGQYLQPTAKQLPVQRFVTPDEFASYKEAGMRMGFRHVESGPLVRSSYHAWRHAHEAASRRTDESGNVRAAAV